jgi:hypothetical protein
MMPFPDDVLDLIDRTREVAIETRRGDRVRRTIIWVVADGGEVFVRSVKGEAGRWYQRALDDSRVALLVDGRRIEARAVHAPDQAERVTSALRAKYPPGGSLDRMTHPTVLTTTMRLDPPG